jgi:signal transduction histidine kinase
MSGAESATGADKALSDDAAVATDAAPDIVITFKRRFIVPEVVLAVVECAAVAYPLWEAFDLGSLRFLSLVRTVVPVVVGATVVWGAAFATWFMPLWQAIMARRRGERVPKEVATHAYRITLKAPVRALLLRTAVWTVSTSLVGLFLYLYDGWRPDRAAALIALAAVHSYAVSCVRAAWLAHTLQAVRQRLFVAGSPLRKFDDSHARHFALVSMIVAGGVLAAQSAFAYYLVPISRQQYLQLETYFPLATLVGVVAWVVLARLLTADLRNFLAGSREGSISLRTPSSGVLRTPATLGSPRRGAEPELSNSLRTPSSGVLRTPAEPELSNSLRTPSSGVLHTQAGPEVASSLRSSDGVAGSPGSTGDALSAAVIYRRAQALPYQLALLTIGVWFGIAVVGALVARFRLGFDIDDTLIVALATFILAVAGAIYEQLWHRDVLRPLLSHLTQRYRVPVRKIAPSLSLRSKLMLSFGGVVLLACGMALLWGFLQYKRLETHAALRQANIGLNWLRSELQTELSVSDSPPTEPSARSSLQRIVGNARDATSVVYYLDDAGELLSVGGGPMGAPKLPWYVKTQIQSADGQLINLRREFLTGKAGRLAITWRSQRYDIGSVAVFYPSYRGRGESMARPLKELFVFFLVLFGACAGVVVFTVAQFMAPIRRLEQRADAMAHGDLIDPVVSGGEGDEIGRLTLALEEMRRKLRDKLRTSEEANLDLERAVQMRTADLARKNRELGETLDKLTRAQQQLVRSEKLASIGQLVAGIAHEINNPVNAIVNTVGPLEEAVAQIDDQDTSARQAAASDVREMVKVVQSGAQRTKAIVRALHNYSRTDDERVVDFDIDRSIDDSLELLRHLLRQNVTVVKNYGDPGRVRGHAGQINQVFLNLLTNAAQALSGRDQAVITIVTSGRAEAVEVKIIDNGPGIPEAVLPRIWDPFFTTKDVGEGTGLGLSIVHELVERHGGTIEVDTHLGVGTIFTVTLPRQKASATGLEAKPSVA